MVCHAASAKLESRVGDHGTRTFRRSASGRRGQTRRWQWRRSSWESGSDGTSPRSGKIPTHRSPGSGATPRIPNFKDGGDAFFQAGVEFPTSWSLNATNIVAQKYFRGTLGTPEREWSLRQVIDRVVDTIADWGVRDGYFTDDEEAAAFRDELKYVLVHQRAAFNSPVWFNIGVKGVPQQASACQPYDALVSTPEGLVPIGELVEQNAVGTKVFDAHGVTKVVAVKRNGRKSVLRIHTKSGLRLDVTPDHLVWRSSGEGTGRFVEAGSLQRGDQLEWHRTDAWGDGDISTRAIAEAALAGWLQSDGFVGQYEGTNRSLTIEAMTVTDDERAWVRKAVDTVFGDAHSKERRVVTQDLTLDCRRLRLYGNHLRPFVERWDLRTRGPAMTVPQQLFTAPLPVVAAVPTQHLPGRGLCVPARNQLRRRHGHGVRGHRARRAAVAHPLRDLLACPFQGRLARRPARLLVARDPGRRRSASVR